MKKNIISIILTIFICFQSSTVYAHDAEPTFDPFAAGSFYQEITPEPTPTPLYNTGKDDVEMVLIPAGSFIMGTDNEFALTQSRPAHEVTLKSYWIDRYEVTNEQYARCVVSHNCTEPMDYSSATRTDYFTNGAYANYPVIHVTWYQANAYCTWVGKRLPTEAEWEKAARGESGLLYPWGNTLPKAIPAQVNQFESGDTVAVDSFPKGVSPYGVYNMEGNVWEWTADQYDAWYYSTSPADNPKSVTGGNDYVIRGFSWAYPFSTLEIYTRASSYVLNHSYDLGFRCAADAD